MQPLVECVPNFSNGRDPAVYDQIADAIRGVAGVQVLDVSADADHNRTVITFVGGPDEVVEAAFRAIQTARDLIDLDHHQGEHPRIGATDVCPFVPVRGINTEGCVALARRLGKRVGEELGVAVYLYGAAATRPERESLADIRKGQYELWKQEVATNPRRQPDYGPAEPRPWGATVIGARPFLIADVRFEVEPHGSGTTLRMTEEPRGPFRVMSPLIWPFVRARNDRSLRRLAELVDGRAG